MWITRPWGMASGLLICDRAEEDYEQRLTWIKPSFLWMMHRCGWGTQEDRTSVLAVSIAQDGKESALAYACLSHYDRAVRLAPALWKRELKRSPARVQGIPTRPHDPRPCAGGRVGSRPALALPRARLPRGRRTPGSPARVNRAPAAMSFADLPGSCP
ncbi:DUF4291 family protein [Streptomyces sp. NPDC102264]|uniref:DUF4291 family protein n=1 Tax=Streptomyces sp. NPDC102264 TaxID=3366149 RepID=UPI0038168344